MTVAETLEKLPISPGCYLFFGNSFGRRAVLYVGKAKNLRNRVRSYFSESSSDNRFFIPLLRAQITEIETVVTATEKEAAILENSLIKQHQPRFNSKLRDDKEFLLLRLDTTKEWPRLTVVRRPAQDSAKYFGPFHTATFARRSLHLVNKHFQLRTCSDNEFKSRRRPCLQHQIKRCPAPCTLKVSKKKYMEHVKSVELFLSGRHDELSRVVEAKMKEASTGLEFELAAIYRDQLDAIFAMRTEQRVVLTGPLAGRSQDVIGLHRDDDSSEFVVLYVREGRVTDSVSFSYVQAKQPDDELVATFLNDHYELRAPPDDIIVPVLPEAHRGIEEALGEKCKHAVVIATSEDSAITSLVALANENARHSFEQKQKAKEGMEAWLAELADKLHLPTIPRRIECCDISHLGGEDTVGSVVALIDGEPTPSEYRWFHVRTADAGDDYAAMFEVLSRRFKRAIDNTNTGEWAPPDLFVVDGGRAQLAVAVAAATELGFTNLPLVGLAKERQKRGVVDRVFLPNQKNPIIISENTNPMVLLMRARDEAHRFANWARDRVGRKARLASGLEEISGIGAKVKKAMLERFGTLEGVLDASDDDLLAVDGFTARHLHVLREHVASDEAPPASDTGDQPDVR